MKNKITAVLTIVAAFAFSSPLWAHGGNYRGPGDTVPPGGSAPGPSSAGPSAPGGAGGPRTGGPSGPSAPTGPGPSTGSSGPAASGPKTGGGVVGPDLSTWTFWWEFNKDPFLNLKAAVHSGGPITGSDDFFVGKDGGKGGRDSQKPSNAQIRGKVVPALLKSLEEETNNDIVTGCLIALGKIGGDPSFVEVIQKSLASSNQEISETAAVALGILSYPQAKETLLELVKDTPKGRKLVDRNEVTFRTRAFAAYGLGLIGYAACQEKTRDEALIQDIVQSLRDVYQNEKSSYKDTKVACILALGLIQDTERKAAEDLRRILDDEKTDKILRAHVPLTLAKLIGRDHPLCAETVKKLIALVEDKKEKDFVRQSAVYALGLLVRHGDEIYEKAIKAIEFAVKETNDEQERNYAMIALGKMGGPEAQSFLMQQLTKGRAQSMRPWAAIGLGILGRSISDAAGVPDRAISQKLHDMLSGGGNPSFLGAYAIALGILRDSASKEILLATMKDVKEDELKGYCCVALGMIGAREAIKDIQEVVQKATRKPELLQQASIGLGLLGDKKLVTDFVAILKEPKSLAVHAAVATALGYIGDQRSIDPLIETLQNKDIQPVGRGFSAVALGLVCDKEMLPWHSKIAVDLNYRATVTTLTDKGTGTGIVDIL